ncbi:T-cell activation inhibitor, mitochondrial-like [Schistocerca gregaria]|uniref:T-cell activation inhibitor, mitochondrial-like n=1 Tax=Schistocerca gregaria TaxID=7010 RepID=UPI00211F0D77|nr:T-cell activation inhibitor, mitochondrial-like [Schistocerca gregaria]
MFFGRSGLGRFLQHGSRCALSSNASWSKQTGSLKPFGRRFYVKVANVKSAKIQAAPKLTPLNTALRSFYLKVHPDLFAAHPEAQGVNENSFKLLTEYLDLYKNENDSEKPFNLVFYLRAPESPSNELSVVRSSLRLPGQHASIMVREEILKNNLSRLFRSCGYYEDFDVTGYGSSKNKLRMARGTEVSLICLILAASSRLKLGCTKKPSADTKTETLKNELRAENDLVKQSILKIVDVKLSLEVPAVLFKTPLMRLRKLNEWLERLNLALTQLRESGSLSETELKGKTITFGYNRHGCYSEASGVIYLDVNQGIDVWMAILAKADNLSRTRQKNQLDHIRKIEKKICSLVGVSHIEASLSIILKNQADYIEFLEKWQSACLAQPDSWRGPPTLKKLTIRFIEHITDSSSIEALHGTAHLPLGISTDEIKRTLIEDGPRLVSQHDHFIRTLNDLKKRYKLNDILLDPQINSEMVVQCVNRLSDGYKILREYLSEMSICISNEYGFNEDTKIMFIKWDFLL